MDFVLRSAQNPANQASNDIVGLRVEGSHFVYCWKPVLGPYNSQMLPYPIHSEFRRRIPYSAWAQFNADLSIVDYNTSSPFPFLIVCPVTAFCFFCIDCIHSAMTTKKGTFMKEIIDHYTKHLFHPMLIDVQIFSEFSYDGTALSLRSPQIVIIFMPFYLAHRPQEIRGSRIYWVHHHEQQG